MSEISCTFVQDEKEKNKTNFKLVFDKDWNHQKEFIYFNEEWNE